ncbi:phage gp6-like head-tail connector protein [Aeribacillus pallidus]|nr:phage gp6-like head-tail connector protein [Aeribacillus pallidus]
MDDLITKLKSHLHWEEGMDESLLPLYLERARKYVNTAIGKEDEWLIIMVAGIFYEYRVSEKELGDALNALTPFFVQGVYNDETDEQT